jgi:hypothetical protein
MAASPSHKSFPMNRTCALVIAMILALLPGPRADALASEAPAKAKPPAAISEARIRSLLPGLWRADSESPPISVKATSNYLRNGTVVFVGHITGPGVDVNYRVKSKWVVEGDVLVSTIVESNRPDMLAVGSVERDRVVEIDGKHFTYVDSTGVRYSEYLIKR